MYKKVLVIIVLGSAFIGRAQNFSRANDWKRYKKEVYGGIGVSNFLGELGGLNKIGTHYSPADLEFNQTRSALTVGYKYKALKWLNFTACFNHLIVRGDDALTAEQFRNNRNLNFKSNIFELAGRVEIVLSKNKAGNRYSIRNTLSRRIKNRSWDFGPFIGIGAFYFNPKGKDQNGQYVKLKPLHTEGQGLPGGPKQYSNFSVCIPMGLVYRMYLKTVTQQIYTIGIELSYRKTFTDYIDDVSTVYYDNSAIAAAYGTKAAKMADPNLGLIPGATAPDALGFGAQRGDPEHKDGYMSVQITVGYIIKQKRGRSRLRSKF